MASSNFSTHNVPPNLVRQLPYPEKPWNLSRPLDERVQKAEQEGDLCFRKCLVLPTDPEWNFVWQSFHHQKPTTYGIKQIYCVYNKDALEGFVRYLFPQTRGRQKTTYTALSGGEALRVLRGIK